MGDRPGDNAGARGDRRRVALAALQRVADDGADRAALSSAAAQAVADVLGADAEDRGFLAAVANVVAGANAPRTVVAAPSEARHDPLTGLANRVLVREQLQRALARAAVGGPGRVALVVVDVDRFRRVNEAHGLDAADDALCLLARRLRDTAGSGAFVGRLAGDRFAVVREDVRDEGDAMRLGQALVAAMRRPLRLRGSELRLTVSAGVALGVSTDGGSGDLVRDAEVATDRAKACGRDRCELFDDLARVRARERARIEHDLRGAVARDELVLACQPIVGVGDGTVVGVEALVRWRHPQRGMLPPGQFVEIAEEAGLIGEIGGWVLRTACMEVGRRHADRPLTCHVNLSPRQAADPTLPSQVEDALAASGLPPEALVLELTESSLMEAGERPLQILDQVRELGVRIVLDDFGTGYSSLGRLRDVPIDGLKIDRSFVAGLDTVGSRDALIVSGLVELARALGMTVVAEGVETEAQLERLERMGCRYAQGFLLARPVDGEALDALLAREGGLLPRAA